MKAHEFDDAFAAYLLQTGMATGEQLESARKAKASRASAGQNCLLQDVLVERGVITPEQRASVERKLNTRQRLGQYELLRKLGEGGMGCVYLAEDTVAQRKVAIKVLLPKLAENPDFLKRFQREARAIGQLNHPNIVNAYAVGEENGQHYYVMEFCEGEGLDALLKKRGRLENTEAVEIVIQVAKGLKHAHSHNIVHRDIKPGNILITKEGTAKILDLGLSKSADPRDESFCTVQGVALGTPHYIAPEQARGHAVDARTDIYSLGAMLFHLVTGRTLFEGPTPAAIMMKQVSEPPPRAAQVCPEVSQNVDALIHRMIQKNPAARYQSCDALLVDLEAALRGESFEITALPAGEIPRIRREVADPRPHHRKYERPPQRSTSAGKPAAMFAIGAIALLVISLAMRQHGGTSDPDTKADAQKSVAAEVKADVKAPTASTALKPAPLVVPEKIQPASVVAQPPLPAPKQEAPPPKQEMIPAAHQENAINLLALVDTAKDTVAGKWRLENGNLVCEKGRFSRLELPFKPPEEYDFIIEFTRKSGNDVNQVLSHAGKNFIWNMGGWDNTVFAFDLVDDIPANESPKAVKSPECLVDGKRYKSVVQVRRDSVTALLNDKVILSLKTDYSNLGIYKMWALTDKALIGVAAHSAVTFHVIDVVEVSGKGKLTR